MFNRLVSPVEPIYRKGESTDVNKMISFPSQDNSTVLKEISHFLVFVDMNENGDVVCGKHQNNNLIQGIRFEPIFFKLTQPIHKTVQSEKKGVFAKFTNWTILITKSSHFERIPIASLYHWWLNAAFMRKHFTTNRYRTNNSNSGFPFFLLNSPE